MNRQEQDEWYARVFEGRPPGAEHAFADVVLQRVGRHRRRRAAWICGFGLLGLAAMAMLVFVVPAAHGPARFGSLQDVVWVLALTGICSLAWLAVDADDRVA